MKTIIGIFLILMALGLIKTLIPPLLAFFSLLRERAFGKSTVCLLVVLAQVGLGILLVKTGIGFLPSEDNKVVSEFIASINSANEASKIINQGNAYSIISESDTKKIIDSYRLALSHAENVDTNLLNQKFSGWGDHFEEEFITGLRLVIDGHEKVDATTSLEGQALLDSWGDWFSEHVREIKKIK